ncbi:MAG TPA: excisionase family DNA-binding protein [Ktedonobacteraceae bacterium]|jgi:excisionase family DNA binding protein
MSKTAIQVADRLVVDPETAAEILSVHRSKLFGLLARGSIRSIKIGRSRRIPVAELEKFIAAELAAQNGEQPPTA